MTGYLKGQDPDRMQRDLDALARRDGRATYPAVAADGTPVTPYLGDSLLGQADSAVAAGVAERLLRRGDVTAEIMEATASILASTAVVGEAREAADRSKHAVVALENAWGTAERERPFLRHWVVQCLIAVLAVAGALNLFGALGEVTDDAPWVTAPLALGIGLSIVFTGAAVARLFKRWELDSRELGRFAGSSRLLPFVAALSFTGMLLVPLGVAVVRSGGHEASVQRSTSSGAAIDVVLPGAAEGTGGLAGAATEEHSEPPTVPTWTWVLFEAAMVVAAFSIEYIVYSPKHDRFRDANEHAAATQATWNDMRQALGRHLAAAAAAVEARADGDLAAVAQGESTSAFFAAMWDWYRDRNGAARPQDIGDPWKGRTPVPAATTPSVAAGGDVEGAVSLAAKEPVAREAADTQFHEALTACGWFVANCGGDLSGYPTASQATSSSATLDRRVLDLYRHAAAVAVTELDRTLTVIELTPVGFDPAVSLAAETGAGGQGGPPAIPGALDPVDGPFVSSVAPEERDGLGTLGDLEEVGESGGPVDVDGTGRSDVDGDLL